MISALLFTQSQCITLNWLIHSKSTTDHLYTTFIKFHITFILTVYHPDLSLGRHIVGVFANFIQCS